MFTCRRSIEVSRSWKRPARAAAVSSPRSGATSQGTTSGGARAPAFEEYVLDLQKDIKSRAERIESGSRKVFIDDRWDRGESGNNGYGITSVLEGGDVLEKAAANISVIKGVLTPERAVVMSSRGRDGIDPEGGQAYSAVAMSLVFHSAHPFIPTLRADVRLFEVGEEAWFGGGCDLTPNYLSHTHPDAPSATDLTPDISAFHTFWKDLCGEHSPALYPRYKRWCDDYFYIPCRKEHRGTGGIFFDDLDAEEPLGAGLEGEDGGASPQGAGRGEGGVLGAEAFTRAVGSGIVPSWEGIVEARRGLPFTEEHRKWQELRRGRYIEFNLLYDRGVRFGLEGGRIESIMVSAPPRVRWAYRQSVAPPEGSPEAAMLRVLREPREWAV
eukprot:jgi/Ulvmu1/10724/UM068_0010.1